MSTSRKNKGGRPPLAAQSFEEAFARAERGDLPARPRNEFERMAWPRGNGRPQNPQSRTRAAAEFAAYLVQHQGATLNAASKQAAVAFNCKSPDTVRRYARAALRAAVRGPQMTWTIPGQQTWFGTTPPTTRKVFLVDSIEDVEAPAD